VYTVCMNTQINFNVDEGLKTAAMRKARQKGVSLSTVLNQATRAFVANTLDIGIVDRDLADDIDRSDDDIKHGRVTPHEEVLKELGFLRSS
jgi:predicted transcriptional regulator